MLVGWLVGWLVSWLVGLLVSWLVGLLLPNQILQFFVILQIGEKIAETDRESLGF